MRTKEAATNYLAANLSEVSSFFISCPIGQEIFSIIPPPYCQMADEKKEILEKFGAYVKQLRKDKGLTMLEIEVLTGISEGSLSKIENGKKNPALTTIVKLAKGLSVLPSELLVLLD